MIRRALSFLRSLSGAEQCFLTLDGKTRVEAIVEPFLCDPIDNKLAIRITVKDRTALCAFIDDGILEFEVTPATMRGFAQFLLRRLREEVAEPALEANRLYEKVAHAEDRKWDRDDYKRAAGK